MYEINQRIRELRTSLGMTQDTFGAAVAMSRSVVKNFEYNKTEPSDMQISLICKTYNVNENWLRTGKGEMFNPMSTDDKIIDAFGRLAAVADDSFVKQFAAALAELTPDEWELVEKFARKVVEGSREKEQKEEED